jgi:radical SAM protein with 4Fe4S-binding SPASM domain
MAFRKEQLYRYRKYVGLSRNYLTLQKLINALKIESKLFTADPDLSGLYPYNLFVDLHNSCNLKCPLCFMGRNEVIPRENKMSLENYQELVAPFSPYVFQVFLQNNGEPFLNKDVYRIIRFNKANRMATIASSNFSLEIAPESIIESGLDYLCLSIDGASEETYSKYRVNGRFGKVIENLKKLIALKRKMRSKTPFIEWQTLVSRYNHTEMQAIRSMAYSMGVDFVRFANLNFFPFFGKEERRALQNEWLPPLPAFRAFEDQGENLLRNGRTKCFWLWRTVIINCDGGILPCCLYDTKEWGNLYREPFEQIWNSETYRRARRSRGLASTENDDICDRCFAPFLRKNQPGSFLRVNKKSPCIAVPSSP